MMRFLRNVLFMYQKEVSTLIKKLMFGKTFKILLAQPLEFRKCKTETLL